MFTNHFFSISSVAHSITLGLLLFLSIVSIGLIIERWTVLRKILKNSQKTLYRLKDSLQSLQFEEIKEEISRNYDSIEGKTLNYGLKYIKKNGIEGLDEVLDSHLLTEKFKLEKFLNLLATIGSNAPFIGLLGTVFGIMDAFRELASQQSDLSNVMLGISRALVATAAGLLVAIPAVIAYNSFQKKVKSILEGFEAVKKLCIAYAKNFKTKGSSQKSFSS